MSAQDEQRIREFGTKVRLFPEPPNIGGFGEPEVVWLSPPAGTIAPGPTDDRMYVIDAIDKRQPYEFPYLPPYVGAANAAVYPSLDGHFDHIEVNSRAFLSVHMYGSLRRVLDIFESYFGRRIEWPFAAQYNKLELIPFVDWDNAQSGYGFMEFGYNRDEPTGNILPYALNFDVTAHEMGHSILFSAMGLPEENAWTDEFRGFHEGSADLTALISLMHFDTVLDRMLRATRGNIYTLNELNRIGELSETRQIRIASNTKKMSDVTREVHDLSRPLTGAVFDLIAYHYLDALRELELVSQDLWGVARVGTAAAHRLSWIQSAFDHAYRSRHFQFKSALAGARDAIGRRLAATWDGLKTNHLTYCDVANRFLEVDRSISGHRFQQETEEIFRWREILH